MNEAELTTLETMESDRVEAYYWAFMYSFEDLLADEGAEYWQFCFGLPVDRTDLKQKVGVYQSAARPGQAEKVPTIDRPTSRCNDRLSESRPRSNHVGAGACQFRELCAG